MLYVHKEFQRKGIATALIKELERRAVERNFSIIETFASVTAVPFFEKMGYAIQTENTVIRNGVVLMNYKMIKVLRRSV